MENLKRSENLYREIFLKLTEAIIILEKSSGKVEFINESGEGLFGIKEKEVIGRQITEFFVKRVKFNLMYEGMLKQLQKRGDSKIEVEIKRKEKDNFWGEINFSLIKDHQGEVIKIIFLVRDITVNIRFEESWIRMQEQLRALTSHIQNVREEERLHIARELHDELSPVLTVLKMDLVNISKTLEDKEKEKGFNLIIGKISKMEMRIDDTILVIRRIITELRPGILDDLGLIPAIEWLVDVFKKKSDIKFYYTSEIQNIDLGKSEDTAVFRIFQESLTNILRHAQAKLVKILIKKKNRVFEMKISDDGIGIKESDLFAKTSFGLMGMRERTENFGWELNINGSENKGTIVRLRIPLANHGGMK